LGDEIASAVSGASGSSPDKGEDRDPGHLGFFFEETGALVGGGSGGEDIIDEDEVLSGQSVAVSFFDREGSAEVREALSSVEFGLGLGATFSHEAGGQGEAAGFCEFASQFVGLVAVPPLLASPMEGNGHQKRGVQRLEALVREEGFVKEGGKGAGQKEMALVFEAMDEVERRSEALQRGAGEIEVVAEALAVLAFEVLVEGSVEGFAAVGAKGRSEPGKLLATGQTE
jgi:hypothetical protein